jgi:hypothetical protein
MAKNNKNKKNKTTQKKSCKTGLKLLPLEAKIPDSLLKDTINTLLVDNRDFVRYFLENTSEGQYILNKVYEKFSPELYGTYLSSLGTLDGSSECRYPSVHNFGTPETVADLSQEERILLYRVRIIEEVAKRDDYHKAEQEKDLEVLCAWMNSTFGYSNINHAAVPTLDDEGVQSIKNMQETMKKIEETEKSKSFACSTKTTPWYKKVASWFKRQINKLSFGKL